MPRKISREHIEQVEEEKVGPCWIVNKISDNTYVVNVVDLFAYHFPDVPFYSNSKLRASVFTSGGK